LLSKEAVAAIRRKTKLKSLTLSHSNLDDAGLAGLPLEQLELLHVTASGVTATGLTELSRCQSLDSVALGADQLTGTQSVGVARNCQVWLAGIEIRYAVGALATVSTLKQVHLFRHTTAPAVPRACCRRRDRKNRAVQDIHRRCLAQIDWTTSLR
jgi:hypothetical protein